MQLLSAQTVKRPRDYGIRFGVLPTGQFNAITDVPGVRVGQVTLQQGANIRTGVTASLPHDGNLFQQSREGHRLDEKGRTGTVVLILYAIGNWFLLIKSSR